MNRRKNILSKKLEKITIQLKWINQAQFAGIYVAEEKGFFSEEGIDARLLQGGPGINIEKRVVRGKVDIGISSFDSLLVSRDKGLPLISIAQIVQGSTQGLITKKSSRINQPFEMNGESMGTFGGSNVYQQMAFLKKFKIEDGDEIILQESIEDFTEEKIDIGAITVYNELQEVFFKGIGPRELNIFLYHRYGVGMLEDTIIVREKWLNENRDLAKRVKNAIIRGWKYAILNQKEAIDIVMKHVDPETTTREQQGQMLRVISPYIVPQGFPIQNIGMFVLPHMQKTANILYEYDITSEPANVREATDLLIE